MPKWKENNGAPFRTSVPLKVNMLSTLSVCGSFCWRVISNRIIESSRSGSQASLSQPIPAYPPNRITRSYLFLPANSKQILKREWLPRMRNIRVECKRWKCKATFSSCGLTWQRRRTLCETDSQIDIHVATSEHQVGGLTQCQTANICSMIDGKWPFQEINRFQYWLDEKKLRSDAALSMLEARSRKPVLLCIKNDISKPSAWIHIYHKGAHQCLGEEERWRYSSHPKRPWIQSMNQSNTTQDDKREREKEIGRIMRQQICLYVFRLVSDAEVMDQLKST